MKSALIKILTVGMTIQAVALADEVAPPLPWFATSENGHYLFKMVPAVTDMKFMELLKFPTNWRSLLEERRTVSEPEAFGIAYRITGGGEFEELWRTKGWYARSGYLSDDGRYFARFGPWASDQKNHTDLAIAFYDRGQLLKQYQVRELIKKPDLLENSVSHYSWRPQTQTKPNGFLFGEEEPLFHLVMIDKTTYKFNYETGEIVATGRDEGAKSSQERFAEFLSKDEKKGKALFEASSFYDDFSRHFEISAFGTNTGAIGLWFPRRPVWDAELRPKRKFIHDIVVRPFIVIEDNKLVDVSITASQILEVIEKAFQHPYIDRLFKDCNATKMVLYIREDRLHLDTAELTEYIEKVTKKRPDDNELSHWAQLTVLIKRPGWVDPNIVGKPLAHIDAPEFAKFVEKITVRQPNQRELEDWEISLKSPSGKPEIHLYLNLQTGEIIGEEEDARYQNQPFLIDANGKRK